MPVPSYLNQLVIAEFGPDVVTGKVIEEYAAEIHGFKLPMVAVRVRGGRVLAIMTGKVRKVIPTITARQATPGTRITVGGDEFLNSDTVADPRFDTGSYRFSQITVGHWIPCGYGQAELIDSRGEHMGIYPADYEFRTW